HCSGKPRSRRDRVGIRPLGGQAETPGEPGPGEGTERGIQLLTPHAREGLPMRAVVTGCSFLLVALSTFRAVAQEDLDTLLDQTVVTAASKSAEVSATAPGTSTVITGQDLKRFGLRTLAEAIDFLSLGAATSGRDVTGEK